MSRYSLMVRHGFMTRAGNRQSACKQQQQQQQVPARTHNKRITHHAASRDDLVESRKQQHLSSACATTCQRQLSSLFCLCYFLLFISVQNKHKNESVIGARSVLLF